MGRRWAVVSAFSVFLIFSLACGFAQTLDQLIVFRAFQGVGGSGLYALTLILSLEISTPKTLPVISGLVGATIAVAGILGPILGGVLTERASWRWIFWIKYVSSTQFLSKKVLIPSYVVSRADYSR